MSIRVPTRVEGQDVLLEHALKQPNDVLAVLQDQPVPGGVPTEYVEAQLFVESARCFQVLDGQADREGAELHIDPQVAELNGATGGNRLSIRLSRPQAVHAGREPATEFLLIGTGELVLSERAHQLAVLAAEFRTLLTLSNMRFDALPGLNRQLAIDVIPEKRKYIATA